jgi:hypothetical protein
MLEAAAYVDQKEAKKTTNQKALTSNGKTLFFHWQYHPNDVDRRALRKIYSETLEGHDGHDGFDAMTVCYAKRQHPQGVETKTVLLATGFESARTGVSRGS